MKVVTSTEAAREFNDLLDRVEDGETVVITREGRRIAEVRPVPPGSGADLIEFGELWRKCSDDEFAADVAVARATVWTDEDPWNVD